MIAERLARGLSEVRGATFTAPDGLLHDVFGGALSHAGTRVSAGSAMGIPAFYSGIKILAETMGTMPLEVRRWAPNQAKGVRVSQPAPDHRLWALLHDQPNPEMPASTFWEILTTHIGVRGEGFGYFQRDEFGRVIHIWLIPPHLVNVRRDPRTRRKQFWLSPDSESAVEYPLMAEDIVHWRGFGADPLRGLSPIGAMRELLGRAIAESEYQSSLMANQARPSGVLTTDKKIDQVRGRRLARRFKRSVTGTKRAGEIVILEQGLQWQQVSLSAADAQFIEQREFTVRDIARMLRLPADMLLVQNGGDMHYTSDESVGLRFTTFTMTPWITRVADPLAINANLPWLEPDGTKLFPRHKADLLLRTDRKTRYETHQIGIDAGFLVPNDARIEEGLLPLDGLDTPKPLTPAPAKEQRSRDLVDDLDALLDPERTSA